MEEYWQIACAVVSVLVLLILMYLGSVYVMRERTFESVIAEQNRQVSEDASPMTAKHDRKARRQQVRSKRPEKEKSQTHDDTSSDTAAGGPVDTVRHHSPSAKKKVELELEPEIIAVDNGDDDEVGGITTTTKNTSRPVSPSKPARSILLNKGEKSDIVNTMSVPETFHIRQISVDELELKLERRRSDPDMQVLHVVDHKESPAVAAVASVGASPSVEQGSSKTKKKKPKSSTASTPQRAPELIVKDEEVIKSSSAALSNSSVSLAMTDTAVPLQSAETSEHSADLSADKKQANELKRLKEQLDEKEKALVKERSQVTQLSKQISELRQELSVDASKAADGQIKSNLALAEMRKAATQASEQHAREMSSMRAQLDALRAQLKDYAHVNQELTSETSRLKGATQHQHDLVQKITVLEDALSKSGATMASAENAKRHLETKLKQHEEQIDKLNKRLRDSDIEKLQLTERLRAAEAVKQSASNGVPQTAEMQGLENRLKEMELERSRLEGQLSSSKSLLLDSEQKLAKTVEDSQLEKLRFESQLSVLKSQLADAEQKLSKSVEDSQLEKVAFEHQISALRSQLTDTEQKLLTSVKEVTQSCAAAQAHQNGVLLVSGVAMSDSSSTTSAFDAATAGGATCSAADSLKASSSNDAGHVTALKDLTANIARLEQQLAAQKQKNEELRQKNYAAVEALSQMEKLAEGAVRFKEDAVRKDTELKNLRAELKELKTAPKNIATRHENVSKPGLLSDRAAHHDTVCVETKAAVSGSATPSEPSKTSEELARLEQLLDAQKQRNNELRQKNSAVMEALGKMEKMAESVGLLRDELDRKDVELRSFREESERLKELVTRRDNDQKAAEKLNHALFEQHKEDLKQFQKQLAEKDSQLAKLEDNLRSLKLASSVHQDEAEANQDGHGQVGRKEVTLVTHIQETSSWDLSQLVLDLDTKTAELNILQSLLDQNENALHNLRDEHASTIELVKRLRSELAEKDLTIEKITSQSQPVDKGTSVIVAELRERIEKKDEELRHLAEKITEHRCSQQEVATDEQTRTKLATLESTVQHYKQLLHDTEVMLSTLEASVEKEETVWKAKVTSAEQQLEKERNETRLLKDRISQLQKQV